MSLYLAALKLAARSLDATRETWAQGSAVEMAAKHGQFAHQLGVSFIFPRSNARRPEDRP